MSRPFYFIAAACLIWSAQTLAAQTNSPTSLTNTDAVNAFVQIQAQLHETQMMVESNREETVAALERNVLALDADIEDMRKTVSDQRVDEAKSARGMEQTMLLVSGVGMIALAVVVAMVFFQLRAATRLIELAVAPGAKFPSTRPVPIVETTAQLPASARAALEFSNARLLGVIERLEKRILELEESVHLPLGEHSSGGEGNGGTTLERRVTDLIVEGQLFLDTNKAEKALHCFEEALRLQPKLSDALIKKAAALEKLERVDDAIASYDRAIELGDSATTALLQKGGMLNRLARYDEALQCYERALQTQEKRAASS